MKKKHDDYSDYKRYQPPRQSRRKISFPVFILLVLLLGLAAAAYFFPMQISEALLTVSGNPNAQLAMQVARAGLPVATPMPTYTPYPTPTPIPPQVIAAQLQPMAKLVVLGSEVYEDDFHVGVEDGLCSHGADFMAQGAIEAGIDFDEIDADSIVYNASSQSYTLKLPAPELTSCRIEYIRLLDNSFSICAPDWDRARIFARKQAMDEFVDEVLEEGILDKAQDHSAQVLGDFVRILTGKPVHITYETRSRRVALPSSRKPHVPRGWHYSSSKNEWRER